MDFAYWLRLVSLALYMTDLGRVDFDPSLVNEYAAGKSAARTTTR